jgi:hypothetical protein
VVIDPGAEAHLQEHISRVISKLADAVRDDARSRYVPTRTFALRDSIRSEMVDYRTAHIGSDKVYAAPVELGYHLVAWGHPTNRFVAPQPYLRPALYTVRRLV